MIVYDDGTFWLDAGERIPFICPNCHFPVPFDASLVEVKCGRCGNTGTPEDFSQEQMSPVRPN